MSETIDVCFSINPSINEYSFFVDNGASLSLRLDSTVVRGELKIDGKTITFTERDLVYRTILDASNEDLNQLLAILEEMFSILSMKVDEHNQSFENISVIQSIKFLKNLVDPCNVLLTNMQIIIRLMLERDEAIDSLNKASLVFKPTTKT